MFIVKVKLNLKQYKLIIYSVKKRYQTKQKENNIQ